MSHGDATFERDDARRRLTIVRTGTFTLDDLVKSVQRMASIGLWAYSVLVDARAARTTLSATEATELLGRIGTIGDTRQRGPISVVTSDDVTFGMARMFSTIAESAGMRVGVFRDVAEARAWLDVAADPLPQ